MAMFEDVEESFIKMLANRVQRLFFLRGDYIIRKDDIGTDVYFIHKGRYSLFTQHVILHQAAPRGEAHERELF